MESFKGKGYVLTFGKHRGKSLEWVSKNDPPYIVWLVKKNVLWVDYNMFFDCQEREDNRWDDLQNAAASYSHEDWGCRD